MKIQSAWHFFFFPCWSDFETPRDPSWTETGVLQHFLLAHSISSSKCGFLCVWWGSSSMWIFSQVLFWFCLFPLRPFCQRLDNGCNHFRLRYKHSWFTARREWGAGRQRSCRQSAGSLDRSSVPSVQLVREWLGGSSRRGGMKWWENWGLQAVKFSSNTWIMFIRGCKHDIFFTHYWTRWKCASGTPSRCVVVGYILSHFGTPVLWHHQFPSGYRLCSVQRQKLCFRFLTRLLKQIVISVAITNCTFV